MADECFIIGIDFGTTYSGVYWCWSGQPDNLQHVTRWKTRTNLTHDNAKAPTEIHYGPSGTTWGYDIPDDQEPIRWFKLLLVKESDLETDVRNSAQLKRARELVRNLGKTPIDVIADYLRLLWNHATDDIIRDRGTSAFRGSPLKVWMTVPAIWDEDAREGMRQAAKKAGILEDRTAGKTTLDLVAEPEAAAMAVLDDFKGRPDVKSGDVFVVCDAGVVLSYAVESTKPLIVRECVEGKERCDKWSRISPAAKKKLLTNDWEYGIKRTYDDSDNKWMVTVPVEAFQKHGFDRALGSIKRDKYTFKVSDRQVPLKANQLEFGRGHIREWFSACIQSIRALIHDQIKAVKAKCDGKPPKAILLVGGLGACQYLYSQLHKEFDPKGIMILQPGGPRPWTAICRGAVIRGLSDAEIQSQSQSLVVSRVSRVSYGSGIHKNCAGKQITKCIGILRGDDIYSKHPVKFTYYRLYARAPDFANGHLDLHIYTNSDTIPPTRKSEVVKSLVRFSIGLDLSFDELSVFHNRDGKELKRLTYEVQMSSTGTEMRWNFLIDGRVVGEQDVDVQS